MKRLLVAIAVAATTAIGTLHAAEPPTVLRGGRPDEGPTILRGGYGASSPSELGATRRPQSPASTCPLGYVLTDEGACAPTGALGGNRQ